MNNRASSFSTINITNSTLVSLRIVQHLQPVENHQQNFCTTANFGQTCLFWKINYISQDTEKPVNRNRTTTTELHINYQSFKKETW